MNNLKATSKKLFLIFGIFLIILVGSISYSLGLFSGGVQVSSLEKGLVAHYPLDGEHGVKDATPNENHGTNNGAVLSTGIKGESEGSYEFDGSNNFQTNQLFFDDINQEWTVTGWVYLDRNNVGQYFNNFNSGNKITHSSTTKALLYANGGENGHYTYSSGTIPTGEWIYFTYVYGTSDRICKIYLNGNLDKSSTNYGETDTPSGFSSTTVFGNNFDGKMSDVRIYDRVLSEDEIKLLYDSYELRASTSDLNKGLVGHWMLDSENGVKDLTPNDNDGTANGGVTIGGATDRKEKAGGATEFDGGDDYINCGNDNSFMPSSITVAGWIKLTDTSSWMLINKAPGGTSGSYYIYSGSNSGATWSIFGPTGTRYNAGVGGLMNLNEWYYLVGTFDSSTGVMRAYRNGVLQDTTLNAELGSNTADVLIGKYTSGYQVGGSISDVRIYNRALSEDEIKLLYDLYKPIEASAGSLNKGLVLDMPLTTTHMKSSSVVADRTPYGNDGIINGAVVGEDSTTFDGIDDYMDLGDIDILNPLDKEFTISVWAKGDSAMDSTGMILSKGNSGGSGYGVWLSTGSNPSADYCDGTIRAIANYGSGYNDDVWHYYTAIHKNDGKTYFYIDGDYKDVSSNIASEIIDSFNNFYIGQNYTGGQFFNGEISNIKIYNRALSDDEIKLLYDKGRFA